MELCQEGNGPFLQRWAGLLLQQSVAYYLFAQVHGTKFLILI
jgi:hypothetical protein